jgi:hypothetical protein
MVNMADTKQVEEEQDKTHVIPSINETPAGVLEEGSLDPVYEAKARVLNKAIQDIGMGKYQWEVSLFFFSFLKMVLCDLTVHADCPNSCSS